jgi:hypothetical protein
MPRKITPKPEPQLGAYELEHIAVALRHLNDSDPSPAVEGPVSLLVETIEPNVRVWADRSEEEGWTFIDWELA